MRAASLQTVSNEDAMAAENLERILTSLTDQFNLHQGPAATRAA